MKELPKKEEIRSALYHDKCNGRDYMMAVGCGAIAGLIDIFAVGAPGVGAASKWTDDQVDKIVMNFAGKCGWSPKKGNEKNVSSAIGFLEKKFPVNYDQRHSSDVGGLFSMSSKNHHMKSLAHSPDIVGLFFSVLNQFTSTSSFLHNGQLITIPTESYELQGQNFVSKLFCGIVNWFGHIMSDVAGSSGAAGRGSGIAIPFYELFQLCDFGSFQIENNRNTLAILATKVFQEGYDIRFGSAMLLSTILCDLSIKLVWAIKRFFCERKKLEECIPSKKYADLRVMLIFGNGTLCLMDGADAAARSGGSWIIFFLRLNLPAWYRFVSLVLRELCLRVGMNYSLQQQLNSYNQINKILTAYLSWLRSADLVKFQKEIEQYNEWILLMKQANGENELNHLLKMEYEKQGIPMPYDGTFNEFMEDGRIPLIFR